MCEQTIVISIHAIIQDQSRSSDKCLLKTRDACFMSTYHSEASIGNLITLSDNESQITLDGHGPGMVSYTRGEWVGFFQIA